MEYVARVEEESEPPRTEFAEFTLRGDRFNRGRLPIDALVELERYRTILLEAAARAWAGAHPGELLPEDFGSEFDLAIVEVRDGSATSLLERPDSAYGEFFDLGRDDVERLFQEIAAGLALPALADANEGHPAEDNAGGGDAEADAVVGADAEADAEVGAAGDLSVPSDNPPRSTFSRDELLSYAALPAFRDLGSSLQIDESAQIVTPDGQQVQIDFVVRTTRIRPLLDRVEQINAPEPLPKREYRKNSVAGRLVSLDPENRSFRVKTLLHGEVSGRYKKDELFDDLKAVLNSSAQAPVVRVVGRMSWADETLKRILEAQQLELLEVAGESWSRNIIELASLPKGWSEDSQTSDVISFTALEAARELLRAAQPNQDSAPGIFPMESGGVHLEWTVPSRVTSVEISADDNPEFVVHTFILSPRSSNETTTSNIAEATAALLEALG